MEKTNLSIEDFEDKKSQGGKRYTRFKTSQGWMSAFDKETIDKLKENEGKEVCVEIAVDEEKGFKNIRKFVGAAEESQKDEKPEVVRPGSSKPAFNQASMYVSYAKDLFLGMIETATANKIPAKTVMTECIELVKQAKEAFE